MIIYLIITIYLVAWLANVIKLWKYINFSEAISLFAMPAVAGYITMKVYFTVMERIVYDASFRAPLWRKILIVMYCLGMNIPGIFTTISVLLVKRRRQIRSIKHPYRRTANKISDKIAINCGEIFA